MIEHPFRHLAPISFSIKPAYHRLLPPIILFPLNLTPHILTAIMPSISKLSGRFIKDGRLQLLEVLGKGSYGTVYRALDVSSLELPKQVYYAVKVMLKSSRRSEQHAIHNRESVLHKSVCDHPNIISMYDIICDDTYRFVVLALCPGGQMFTPITRCRFYLQDDLIKSIFIQLIDALHYCHEKGIFHRDIKPDNILCSSDSSKVFLADFGLATKREVSNHLRCGSLNYMSPG
jgi:serine/threonine protein kinase